MGNLMFTRSGRLFARPSFWEGYGRAIDLGTTLNEYNLSKTSEDADTQSILSDWLAVGDGLYSAMDILSREKEIVR